jgi:heavy metal sensor kinase
MALGRMRVRLTLWYVAVLAVSLGLFCVVLYFSLARALYAELDRLLAAQADQVIATADVRSRPPVLNERPGDLAAGVVVALFGRTGERLIVSDARYPLPDLAEAITPAAQGDQNLRTVVLAGGERWRVLTLPVADRGGLAAVVQVARSERDVALTLQHLLLIMALALPLVLLFAVAGGLFLAGRALDPIDRITRTAAHIGAEDLSRRLQLEERDDEVGRLAATFDDMLGRLEEAFQRQRRFTADVSHELRTPLTMISSQLDVALERPRTAGEYASVLGAVREDAGRLSQLIGELLTLARADAGQEMLEREPLRLDELAREGAAAMAPLATARNVVLVYEPDGPVSVAGDQTRLTQLIVNLVDNGLKYTPPGGRVTVSAGLEGDAAFLRVSDTGVGIPAEHLPQVFERFYRVDPARTRSVGDGSGLGLAISRWIARAHGGEIRVESAPGRGTTFAVTLPALPPESV